MGLGVLLIVGALFPRFLKQWLMLGLGGSLVYRGLSGQSVFGPALDVSTMEASASK